VIEQDSELEKKERKIVGCFRSFLDAVPPFSSVQWMEFASSVAFWGSDLSHSSPFVPEYE